MKKIIRLLTLSSLFSTVGCANTHDYRDQTVAEIELSRFLGKWYVWAGHLTFLEKGAYNATETYTWNEKKKFIDVDFRMNKDALDGKLKKYPQKAWIADEQTKSHWKIQFFWPIKFDYLIAYIAPDYSATIVTVPSKRYVWLMGRSPQIDAKQFEIMKGWMRDNGVDDKNLQYVPHSK